MNMKMNILMIPKKLGRKGHPKIYIHSMSDHKGYMILGYCQDFGCKETNANQQEGINIVLGKIMNHLQNPRANL